VHTRLVLEGLITKTEGWQKDANSTGGSLGNGYDASAKTGCDFKMKLLTNQKAPGRALKEKLGCLSNILTQNHAN
jgi:hypothetical protein